MKNKQQTIMETYEISGIACQPENQVKKLAEFLNTNNCDSMHDALLEFNSKNPETMSIIILRNNKRGGGGATCYGGVVCELTASTELPDAGEMVFAELMPLLTEKNNRTLEYFKKECHRVVDNHPGFKLNCRTNDNIFSAMLTTDTDC